jgi:hypothetical protein
MSPVRRHRTFMHCGENRIVRLFPLVTCHSSLVTFLKLFRFKQRIQQVDQQQHGDQPADDVFGIHGLFLASLRWLKHSTAATYRNIASKMPQLMISSALITPPAQTRSQKRTYQNANAKNTTTSVMKITSNISIPPLTSLLSSFCSLVEVDADGGIEEVIAFADIGIAD